MYLQLVIAEEVTADEPKKKKKKKHKEKVGDSVDIEAETETNKDLPKKKKKKKKKRKLSADEPAKAKTCDEPVEKKQKKYNNSDNKTVTESPVLDNSEVLVENCDAKPPKSKEKKKKDNKKHSDCTVNEPCDAAESTEIDSQTEKSTKKDKKKHKKSKDTENSTVVETSTSDNKAIDESVSVGYKKKKKKSKHVDKVSTAVEDCEIKENENSQEQKNGISSSTELKTENKKEPSAVGLGQWGTSQMGDENRQNKFLRLLGGMKKTNSASTGFSKFASMAMNRKDEKSLNNNLGKQFEQAQITTFHNTKGSGLGFSDNSSRISMFEVKSKQFDD
eukprot:GHVU01136761.1.p1 GENE.GHVU01136761.1~~GHVU01136761.1.p1  ORF type:complete len:333 (-),score=81.44 GHVU01136761.1:51-1049(-)